MSARGDLDQYREAIQRASEERRSGEDAWEQAARLIGERDKLASALSLLVNVIEAERSAWEWEDIRERYPDFLAAPVLAAKRELEEVA